MQRVYFCFQNSFAMSALASSKKSFGGSYFSCSDLVNRHKSQINNLPTHGRRQPGANPWARIGTEDPTDIPQNQFRIPYRRIPIGPRVEELILADYEQVDR